MLPFRWAWCFLLVITVGAQVFNVDLGDKYEGNDGGCGGNAMGGKVCFNGWDEPNYPGFIAAATAAGVRTVTGGPTASIDDETIMAQHSADWGGVENRRPNAVVFPQTCEQTARVVQLANEYNVLLSAQGTRHSQGGQPLVYPHGIAVSMLDADDINIAGGGNPTLTVGAGATWNEIYLQSVAAGFGPPVHTDGGMLSVGGTLAVSGGGAFSLTRGRVTSPEWINYIKVVRMDGSIRQVGPDSRGDDKWLFGVVRGGLGQFGIICEAQYKAIPIADMKIRRWIMFYDNVDDFIDDGEKMAVAGAPQHFDSDASSIQARLTGIDGITPDIFATDGNSMPLWFWGAPDPANPTTPGPNYANTIAPAVFGAKPNGLGYKPVEEDNTQIVYTWDVVKYYYGDTAPDGFDPNELFGPNGLNLNPTATSWGQASGGMVDEPWVGFVLRLLVPLQNALALLPDQAWIAASVFTRPQGGRAFLKQHAQQLLALDKPVVAVGFGRIFPAGYDHSKDSDLTQMPDALGHEPVILFEMLRAFDAATPQSRNKIPVIKANAEAVLQEELGQWGSYRYVGFGLLLPYPDQGGWAAYHWQELWENVVNSKVRFDPQNRLGGGQKMFPPRPVEPLRP